MNTFLNFTFVLFRSILSIPLNIFSISVYYKKLKYMLKFLLSFSTTFPNQQVFVSMRLLIFGYRTHILLSHVTYACSLLIWVFQMLLH